MTVLDPRRFPHSITRRRESGSFINQFGEVEQGTVTDTPLTANVQPLSLADDEFEGGGQVQERIKAFLPEADSLVAAFEDSKADKVLWGGKTYIVEESRSWPGGHCRATLLRET